MKEELYSVYSVDADMTFIMKDVFDGDEVISSEVVGWHYGEPSETITPAYIGKLKATF